VTAPAGGTDRWELARRRLYLCTPDRPDLDVFLGRCIAGGVDVVQLREKHLDDAELVRRAAVAQRVCTAEGVPFVLNDRPDLAAEMGADGVHVGQDDQSAASARATVGTAAIVGLSTHTPAELAVAARGGVRGAISPNDRLAQRRVDLGGQQRRDAGGAHHGSDHDQGGMPAEDQGTAC